MSFADSTRAGGQSAFLRVHGADPLSILPQIVRDRVFAARYWKEHCFGLDAETILDRIRDLEFVGFCFGGFNIPSNFLCLLTKLLQIAPNVEVIQAYLAHSSGLPVDDPIGQRRDLRYLRALVVTYVRLVGSPVAVHQLLEPLLVDYRKLMVVNPGGEFKCISMDEWIAMLIDDHERSLCGFLLPLIPTRSFLQTKGLIPPYQSHNTTP